MWDKAKHIFYLCSCGRRVKPAGRSKHEAGVWHRQYRDILSMQERGLSYAEIGRQVGVSRVYIGTMFVSK